MTNGKHGISFARRLRTALALIADIRGKDCLTALEFMKLVYPNQRPLMQALKFAGWSLDLVWSKMPDALRHVTIDKNISKTPYWQTAPNPLANHPWADSPDAALPTEADAVVIGAGFGGSSVAYHWSKHADGNLVILDSMDPASGSAGRNAGHVVMAGGAYHGYYVYRSVLKYLPEIRPELAEDECSEIAGQFADVYVRALHASHELILETIENEGIECDYVRRGQVHIGEEADRTDVEAALSLAGKLGHDDYQRLHPKEVKRMSGAESQLDGAVSVGAGTWHPAKWVWGILQAAIASGKVRLFTRTAARAVERDGDGYLVRTDRGDIRTQNVVNATDSHTQRLFDSWLDVYPDRRLVWPYRVQGIYAEPAPAAIPTGVGVITGLGFFSKIPKGGTVFGTDHSPVKPDEAGRIDPSRFVTKFMCAELSRLWGAIPMRVTHEWTGSVGVAPDWFPVVGPMDDDRLYILSGFCGSGSATSFNAGQHIVFQILGKECEPEYHPPEFFSPMRFTDTRRYGPQRVSA